MNMDIFFKINNAGKNLAITRCPDILAFYLSLDRFFPLNHDFVGERHPFYELVYVIKGSVGVTAGNQAFQLNEGQMILHPPEEFHRIWSVGESQPHVINLSFYAASMPLSQGRVLELQRDDGDRLQAIANDVRRGIKNADRQLLNEQRLLLELFLLRVIGKGENNVPPSDSASALRYAEIVNLLREHLCEPLTAQEIANLANMSLSSLKKTFTHYAGMGVIAFFTEMKMRHAVILLQSGKRVGETALELGYTDQNYFSTVFHRVMGSAPGAYRAQPVENPPLRKQDTTIGKEKNTMKMIQVDTYEQLSRQAANIISAQVIMKPDSVLGLATGSSPIGVYKQLVEWYKKGDIDFSETVSINLDEYKGLCEDNEQSYRYFMQKHFFDHINIRRENTYVPNGCAEDVERECVEYDARIERLGGIDLQLLGIGMDGHIGFNEPGTAFVKHTHVVDLHESTIEANARFFASPDEVPRQALTMGMVSIMQAKKIVLIAAGKQKKKILEKAFFGPITPAIPASILQLHPNITVIYSEE